MLDIVASYHRMHFQEKPMIQTQENDTKPHFGPHLGPNSGHQFLFQKFGFVSQ